MTKLDRLYRAPENPEETSGVDRFAQRLRLRPEAAQAAFDAASQLLAALRTAVRPEISVATKAELDRIGADPACVVVDESGGATIHNSPEQADLAAYGPGWKEALQIVLTTPRAPQ